MPLIGLNIGFFVCLAGLLACWLSTFMMWFSIGPKAMRAGRSFDAKRRQGELTAKDLEMPAGGMRQLGRYFRVWLLAIGFLVGVILFHRAVFAS